MGIIHEKHISYPESILIRRFIGVVRVKDIIDSWEYLINNQMINNSIKGVISDLSECELMLDMGGFRATLTYMSKHECLKKIKQAVIALSPEIIIFPSLAGSYERKLQIKPFSTMEAAVDWILENQ